MEILSKKNVYNGFLKLNEFDVKLDNGEIINREVIDKKDTVAIVAINNNNEVYFVKQPRVAINKDESIELPAGLVEPGENPEISARRELEEETGCICDSMELIQKFVADPGCCDNISYLYLARGAKKVKDLNLDKDEFLECFTVPLEEAFNMIDRGELIDAVSLISLLRLKNILKN